MHRRNSRLPHLIAPLVVLGVAGIAGAEAPPWDEDPWFDEFDAGIDGGYEAHQDDFFDDEIAEYTERDRYGGPPELEDVYGLYPAPYDWEAEDDDFEAWYGDADEDWNW